MAVLIAGEDTPKNRRKKQRRWDTGEAYLISRNGTSAVS
jgi:hypothetical protein